MIAPQPPHHSVADGTSAVDLSARQLNSFMNVAVFTPYAIYLARGKRPPGWLIAASLGWLAVQFFNDMRYLLGKEPAAPTPVGTLSGPIAHPPPPPYPMTMPQAYAYRVNRP